MTRPTSEAVTAPMQAIDGDGARLSALVDQAERAPASIAYPLFKAVLAYVAARDALLAAMREAER